jgi:phosphoenolpyruvate carboxykinase (ATP)
VYHPDTHRAKYENISIIENTRCAYPIEYIPNADPVHGRTPAEQHHHAHLRRIRRPAIHLEAYARAGELPLPHRLHLVRRRDPLPGRAPTYASNSKTSGTEDGVPEPIPTFSKPFIVLSPGRYAEMLADRMAAHNVTAG